MQIKNPSKKVLAVNLTFPKNLFKRKNEKKKVRKTGCRERSARNSRPFSRFHTNDSPIFMIATNGITSINETGTAVKGKLQHITLPPIF